MGLRERGLEVRRIVWAVHVISGLRSCELAMRRELMDLRDPMLGGNDS